MSQNKQQPPPPTFSSSSPYYYVPGICVDSFPFAWPRICDGGWVAVVFRILDITTDAHHQIYLPFQSLADNIIISTLHLFSNAEWLHYFEKLCWMFRRRRRGRNKWEGYARFKKNPFQRSRFINSVFVATTYSQCLLLKFPHFDTINLIILVHNTPPTYKYNAI